MTERRNIRREEERRKEGRNERMKERREEECNEPDISIFIAESYVCMSNNKKRVLNYIFI
jgi:hypothetical protein